MRRKSHQRGCARCFFVPTFVMSNLARQGKTQAQVSVQQSELTRQRRKEKINSFAPFSQVIGLTGNTVKTSAAPGTGASVRQVYDCQHEFEQRVKLARSEGKPVTNDEDVNLIYDYSGVVRDYLKNVLGRDSIDNMGMDLILNVHFGTDYLNAFWDGDEMTFGDGDGELFVSFAKSLDVVAHELAHGVVQFTANLEYNGQSGALNEHFADVFGSAITQYANGQTADDADWLIGDEIMGPELYGEALRSMRSPGTAYDNPLLGKDPQPGHMRDYYGGKEDNGGVHINSGIFNRVFYLVATEIGTDKATLAWYTALQKLWYNADFKDAMSVIVQSTRLLIKDGKLKPGSTQIVRAAFKDVGL